MENGRRKGGGDTMKLKELSLHIALQEVQIILPQLNLQSSAVIVPCIVLTICLVLSGTFLVFFDSSGLAQDQAAPGERVINCLSFFL